MNAKKIKRYLMDWRGADAREIAHFTGIPLDTCRTEIQRLIKKGEVEIISTYLRRGGTTNCYAIKSSGWDKFCFRRTA